MALAAFTLGAFTAFLALAAQALEALTESLAVFAAKLALINIPAVRAIDLSVRCGDISWFAQRNCRRAIRHQRRGRQNSRGCGECQQEPIHVVLLGCCGEAPRRMLTFLDC